jgi:hypothetical protein
VIWRRRTMLYAALALATPLPALALTGNEGGSGLSVEASLEGCGVNGPRIVCEINASFGSIEGADYYTASVAAPDGSVTDFGQVAGAGGGGTSLWVPYVGNGTYSVTVTAWGDDAAGRAEVIDKDKASTGEAEKVRERDGTEVGETTSEEPDGDPGQQAEQPAEEPAEVPAPVPEDAEPPCPPTEPVEPAPAPAPPAGEDASGGGDVPQSATTEASPSVAPPAPGCEPAAPVAPAP